MSKVAIKLVVSAVISATLLAAPVSVLAAVNADAQSAATAGIQYLADHQASDGSISGFGGESDWSVEAITAAGQQASSFAHNGSTSLLDFLKADTPGSSPSATSLERKIIAIAAAGEDASSFGGINYSALLEAQHTDSQIGDVTLLNDDIFGIIAIDAAHASQLQPVAQDGLDYLLAHQAADGGFSYSTASCAWCGSDTNDTAAAIIALDAAEHFGLTNSTIAASRASALSYLLSTQNADGGFGYDGFSPSDGSSTAWSLMALNMIGTSVTAPAQLARTWLLQDQNADGGFSYGAFGVTDSDTYTTAHAVIALLGSTWLLRPTPIITSPSAIQPEPTTTGGSAGQSTPPTTSSDPASPAVHTTALQVTSTSTSATLTPTDTPAPTTDEPTDSTSAPQVKGASTTTASPSRTSPSKPSKSSKSSHNYAIYAVALLGLVALTWFMLESRQSKRAG